MPPPGGFEQIKYKRNLPFRGPGGLVILAGVTTICAYGFYRLGLGNLEKRYFITFIISTDRVSCHLRENVLSIHPLDAKRGSVGIRPRLRYLRLVPTFSPQNR
jgi:GRIM-19 protein